MYHGISSDSLQSTKTTEKLRSHGILETKFINQKSKKKLEGAKIVHGNPDGFAFIFRQCC